MIDANVLEPRDNPYHEELVGVMRDLGSQLASIRDMLRAGSHSPSTFDLSNGATLDMVAKLRVSHLIMAAAVPESITLRIGDGKAWRFEMVSTLVSIHLPIVIERGVTVTTATDGAGAFTVQLVGVTE